MRLNSDKIVGADRDADFLLLQQPQSRFEGLNRFSVSNRNVAFLLENKMADRQASMLLRQAVKRGEVTKPKKCERCGKFTIQQSLSGHHNDYSKPLDVKWLCKSCHCIVERELGKDVGFKKGYTPWMTGRKHTKEARKKMEHTWFKKGFDPKSGKAFRFSWCAIEGCKEKHHARQLCDKHYLQWLKSRPNLSA